VSKYEVYPIWTSEYGLAFVMKGQEWLGEGTPQKMRELSDYLNKFLEEYESDSHD
jgi:hypothetical protein